MSKRNHNKFLLGILVAIMAFACIATICFTSENIAIATSNADLSVEAYTDSDNLLTETGTQSSRTIRDFARDVKRASAGTAFTEIRQVIPISFLESNENTVYKYCGKEYGFNRYAD